MRHRRIPERAGARLLIVCLALAGAPIPAIAQSGTQAAFASRLTAAAVDHQIKLTWIDTSDLKGNYLVYRSLQEITSQNIGQATFVDRVGPGVQFFIDTPPDLQAYFYAVLVQDPSGSLHSILVPFRNKTSIAVAAAASAPEQLLAARITGIRAAVSATGEGMEISFKSSNPGRDLLLFRATAPLGEPEDLLRSTSTTQLDAGTTRALVAALPGVDYWFAVLDAGMYKLGKAPLEKGANATSAAIQIPVGRGSVSLAPSAAARRAQPLPSLTLAYGVQNGLQLASGATPELPPQAKLSLGAQKAVALLMAAVPPLRAAPRPPQVLTADTTPTPDGETAAIQAIVKGPFLGGDMAAAVLQLTDFLRLPRAPAIEAHARFYLGQAYFFQDRTRDALLEFLMADEHYYHDVEAWKDACFVKLEAIDK
jgi:hypothetical protein